MDAASSVASSSITLTRSPASGGGPAEPEKPGRVEQVEPGKEAARQRAEQDREQGQVRLQAEREKSDAGPGVGRQIDITV
jgi:hypothetical protein